MHGLYWLLAALAERAPILLAIDDAQWIDQASLEWLAYLRRRIEGLAVVVMIATRTVEHDIVSGPLHALLSDQDVTRLSVGALGERSVATLTEQVLGAEPEERL